jgi:hypothetical protein
VTFQLQIADILSSPTSVHHPFQFSYHSESPSNCYHLHQEVVSHHHWGIELGLSEEALQKRFTIRINNWNAFFFFDGRKEHNFTFTRSSIMTIVRNPAMTQLTRSTIDPKHWSLHACFWSD